VSFQAYIDNIKAKTGKTPKEFISLAEKKGFLKPGVKAGEIVKWLKEDFGLGHGHAMAIVLVLRQETTPPLSVDEKIAGHFSGSRSEWRPVFDSFMKKVGTFGNDIRISPTDTYLSLVRNGKKFAVLQITSNRIDIGIKLKGASPPGRFGSARGWNAMVTHRVRISNAKQIDAEVFRWLRQAYNAS